MRNKLIFAVLGVVVIGGIIGLAVFLSTSNNGAADEVVDEGWKPKDVINEISQGRASEQVAYGYQLLSDSQKHMGPQAEDPEMRFTGNNLACTSCHLDGGNTLGASSWAGVTMRYPSFRGRSNAMGSIQDRINGCIERSMNGKMLPEDSDAMRAMVAYMEWLAEDMPPELVDEYAGFADFEIPDVAVDLDKGEEIYVRECAVCHQADGQGQKMADFSSGYAFPPLWGDDSYNDGAGMHRVLTAASYIKANMPFAQASRANPKLSDLEAFHVAGYINSFPRPAKSDKEDDFPDRTLKPVSTPYGPWADDFPAEQHKFGPFPPIIDFYKETHDLVKHQ